MRFVFAILKRDYAHVRHNVIALLVCLGLAVMPSLYAWFNIAGAWDPYANTNQIKVALANSDEGITGNIIPYRVNVGERVVSQLAGSPKIGYVVTSEQDAVDGVSAGRYYAAVVIPKDFSAKLLSVFSASPEHPQFDYYVNEKRNAIASIVTGKASGSVQNLIDTSFTESISEAVTELMGELSGLLDDDSSLLLLAGNLSRAYQTGLRELRSLSENLALYKGVVGSLRNVVQASQNLVGDKSLSLDGANLLSDAAGRVRSFGDLASRADTGITEAINNGKSSVAEIETALDEVQSHANDKISELESAFGKVKDAARSKREDLQRLRDALSNLNGTALDLARSLSGQVGDSDVNVTYANTLTTNISDLMNRVDNGLAYLDEITASCDRTVANLGTARSDAQAGRDELAGLVQNARESIDGIRGSYAGKLEESMGRLASALDTAAADASGAATTLKDEAGKIGSLVGNAETALKDLEEAVGSASAKIDSTIEKMETLHAKLEGATTSGDLNLVRTIFAADADQLVDFFTSPVELQREALYPVENNGSGMAPFYTTMALWVGGTLMGVLLYAAVSKKALQETGANETHAYFGRLGFFLTIGAAQSTILLLGDLFFLGVQCAHPLQFMITGWLASLVFINIVYALSSAFGDMGKAIGVLLMVLQVAGSGGTFPVEMLPPLFQTLYRFLPFVYSETAMREALFGMYDNTWLTSIATLAAYLIPALLVGLVLRKPVEPVNEWIEERLEKTKFM